MPFQIQRYVKYSITPEKCFRRYVESGIGEKTSILGYNLASLNDYLFQQPWTQAPSSPEYSQPSRKADLYVHNAVELDRGAIVMANNRIWEYIIIFAVFRESQNMLFKVDVSVKPRLKKSWQ